MVEQRIENPRVGGSIPSLATIFFLSNYPMGNAMPDSVKQSLTSAAVQLGSRLDAEVLLCHVLTKPRAWLFAHDTDPLSATQVERFQQLIKRRLTGEPIAYLVGEREFYGRDFSVTPAVLIPRPETELLVELTLELDLPDTAQIADIGTGSGCIGLTLTAERPGWTISLCDLSDEALQVAASNSQRLGLDARTQCLHGDLLDALPNGQSLHAIVSNPPYIADGDHHLEQGDLRFEPAMALSSGTDGLDTLKRLVNQSPQYLLPGGWLLMEHGYDQAAAVRELLKASGFSQIASHRDLAGIERVTLGRAFC